MSNFRFEQGAYVEIRMFVQGMVKIEPEVEAEYPVDHESVPCLLGGEKSMPVPFRIGARACQDEQLMIEERHGD